ncbi:hypothetical protein SAY86_023245 [Trapa natans]|uniref:Uncharacterized protein n=1 Tax=Trapa natans TaxID=22666 RepID=A0AAN7LUQ7_TRANT|nr:hypothetical protein SAY86_023245 [Trapa natans]
MSMYRKFPQEIFQRDDSIYSVSSESQIMDYHQYTSSSYDNLQNDSSVRLSDTSDMDYILSFDPSLRSSEANSQHCFSFSTVSHEMPSSSNSFIMVIRPSMSSKHPYLSV